MKSYKDVSGTAVHPSATGRLPSADAQAGINWWNSLKEEERKRWADQVGTGVVADAWQAAKIGNAKIVFDQIAELAQRIDREQFFFENTAMDQQEGADLLLWRAREALLQIGWLCDLGTKQLTGRQNTFGREGAADWMASPIFDRGVSHFVDAAASARGAAS